MTVRNVKRINLHFPKIDPRVPIASGGLEKGERGDIKE